MPDRDDAFCHRSYYLDSRFRHEGKRSWQAYTFHAPDGAALLSAEVTGIPADIAIRGADRGQARLWLRPRPLFAVRGAYDVSDARSDECLGVLERGGRILGPDERPIAVIGDPATVWNLLKEGAVNAVVDAVLSTAEGRTATHRADALQLRTTRGEVIGTCARTALPFAPGTAETGRGFSLKTRLDTLLPARAAARLRGAFPSTGWRVDFTADGDDGLDPRLRLAAAFLRIEIERRFHAA